MRDKPQGNRLTNLANAIEISAKAIADRDGTTIGLAYSKVIEERPELYAAYDAEHRRNNPPVPPNLKIPQKARAVFFHAIERLSKHVLVDLRDTVFLRSPAERRTFIDLWAHKFRLTYNGEIPPWLLEQVDITLKSWRQYPGLTNDEEIAWGYSALQEYAIDRITIEVSIGSPSESKPHKRERMRKEASDEIDRFLKRYRIKSEPEHVDWFVRHQVNGEPPEQIASTPGHRIGVDAVKVAIRAIARLIGIDARLFGKPGRPRKKP